MNRQQLEKRVIQAAEESLKTQHYVSCIDVLLGIGYLQAVHLKDWRYGQVPYLEKVLQANLGKISYAMQCFRRWAKRKGLNPSETAYVSNNQRNKRRLQFSKSGKLSIERAYRTHFVSPRLAKAKQKRLKNKLEQPAETIVFQILREAHCVRCNKLLAVGSFLSMTDKKPHCLTCDGLSNLVFLPAGDAKVTRAAKKLSKQYAVVVKFSRARKRYERQGLLVEEHAMIEASEL